MALRGLFAIVAALIPAAAQQMNYPAPYRAARNGGQYMHNYYIPPAPGTTPWAPAWSPDGRFLAFAMQGSIWKVELATGIATEISYSGKYHSSPAWSPDGRWIAYTADNDARSIQLEIVNVETGETRALTADEQIYLDPAWSPDGKQLAYVSTKPAGYFNIYTRAIADGKWAGEEVALTRDNRYPRDRLYFGAWDFHTQPAWTPDGRELLFVSNRDVPLGSGNIWRMPARRDGMQEGKAVFAEQTLYRTRPDISSDGKRFVYSSTSGTADQFSNLYVLPVGGGQPYKLTFGQYDHFWPKWSPDGQWIAHIANEGGLPWLWLLETYGGGRKKVEFTQLKWKRPMGRLWLRVIDDKGRTTAARIHPFSADGKFYAPMTAYARRGRSGMHSFHTQGEENFEVPPGRLRVTAVKGFEWEPATQEVEVRAGAIDGITVQLRPLKELDDRGWFSASTHVHMNYGGNLRNTPENLLRMAKAENLDVVLDQVANKDNRILDYQYFVPGGGEHPASLGDPWTKLLIGQEYRPPFYGHVFFLGLRDHLISPFTTGYEGTGIESLYPSNTDMFRKARQQGALTGYVHAFANDSDPLERDLGVAKGFAVDAALSTFDCLEFSSANRATLIVLFHAWNNDLKITPVGGEDSISNLHWTKLVGSVRSYAYTGSDRPDPREWLDAARKGRTFMSTGPLLEFRIDGKLPGDEIRLGAQGGRIEFRAKAQSIAPLAKVVIYRNGKPWKDVPADGLTHAETVTDSAWYALYAEGANYPMLDGEFPQALSNAIRVYVGDGKIRNRESAEYFDRWITKLRGMAEKWEWWRSQKEKDHVFAQFEEARGKYRALAEQAGQARR
jgi:TolB protein